MNRIVIECNKIFYYIIIHSDNNLNYGRKKKTMSD